MSRKLLFGAEADKIQDTLFRVARQRQVVGGSRLLVEFGEQARALARAYGAAPQDVLVASGGSFRIQFSEDKRQDIEEFGNRLADAYRLLMDASITLAELQTFDADFKSANEEVGRSIRRRKQAERGAGDNPHSPAVAYCQSSGVGLAVTHGFDYRVRDMSQANTQEKRYLSQFAQSMAWAGIDVKEDESRDSFLGRVRQHLPASHRKWDWADDVDRIAQYDGQRSNIAYLIADVNNMGELFGECETPEELKLLSDHLDDTMYRITAHIIPALTAKLPGGNGPPTLPVLPLILAGDDAFVVLPALYAIDAAQQFCLEFEEVMQQSEVVQRLIQKGCPPPTIAAAVVICKGHFPYYLAHQRGELLLEEVKRLIKTVGARGEGWRSALAFDFIIGSELVSDRRERLDGVKPSLSVYWATSRLELLDDAEQPMRVQSALSAFALSAALPVQAVLDQRKAPKDLPNKRLAELRELFDPESLPSDAAEMPTHWNPRLEKLRARLKATDRVRDNKHLAWLDEALKALGDSSDASKPGHWKPVRRGGRSYLAHGLPDLIEAWNYTQALDHNLSEYTGEAR